MLEPPLHASRIRAHPIASLRQADDLEHLVDAPGQVTLRHALEPPEEPQVLDRAEVVEERSCGTRPIDAFAADPPDPMGSPSTSTLPRRRRTPAIIEIVVVFRPRSDRAGRTFRLPRW
jgi:hypothetical protein